MNREQSAYPAFQKWLFEFPQESVDRLRMINMSSGSSKHVILSLAIGLYDPRIRKLNGIITNLLVARMKADRHGKVARVAHINAFMEAMHVAIDRVTGVEPARRESSTPCNRTARGNSVAAA